MSDSEMREHSTAKTVFFVIVVCFVCALLLSVIASLLKTAQERAKELDRSKQMLIAAKILSYDNHFLLLQDEKIVPAIYQNGKLVPGKGRASEKEILAIYSSRVLPRVTNDTGDLLTFEEAGLDFSSYIQENQKKGYAKLPYKLLYLILEQDQQNPEALPYAYIFPINGFGLWDAIYGYLAIENDANTVIGTTWYQQAETAGLGADISLPTWQKQFFQKHIFLESPDGQTNFAVTPLGITVVKGKVSEILGSTPKAKSAVDGISGASLTGAGVTSAYHASLTPYRPFLLKARQKYESQ